MRLSKDDERQGESLSIEHQRTILRKYAEEHGFTVYDEYIDDGVSGTTFQRPEVQRLLDDAKTGVINTIIVKDLSRFGRNYIEVGQYVDYVFPAFGIRFIAIQDNIDTENRDSNAMEMMPIMNVFNEWHAANTSKKLRAVKKSNALAGIYNGAKLAYSYMKATDEKHTPLIDEEVAPVVVRIEIYYYYTDKKDPDEPTDKVHRDLTFHHYNVRVRKTYFGLLTKIKKDTAHCSRSSTVSLLVHRKRFELLAFGSVDRRYIQLS